MSWWTQAGWSVASVRVQGTPVSTAWTSEWNGIIKQGQEYEQATNTGNSNTREMPELPGRSTFVGQEMRIKWLFIAPIPYGEAAGADRYWRPEARFGYAGESEAGFAGWKEQFYFGYSEWSAAGWAVGLGCKDGVSRACGRHVSWSDRQIQNDNDRIGMFEPQERGFEGWKGQRLGRLQCCA